MPARDLIAKYFICTPGEIRPNKAMGIIHAMSKGLDAARPCHPVGLAKD